MPARLNTLVEVQVLSLATLIKWDKKGLDGAVATMKDMKITNPEKISDIFRTVGLATRVSVNDSWGTSPTYGIGAPTRPILVPNNYSASISIEKLQLDRKNNFSYVTSPDYWYSIDVQKTIGLDDFILYTYLVIRDKERPSINFNEIYACFPASASQAYNSGDAMIAHDVEMVGFKLTYNDLLNELSDRGILSYSRTVKYSKADDDIFGAINKGSDMSDDSYDRDAPISSGGSTAARPTSR